MKTLVLLGAAALSCACAAPDPGEACRGIALPDDQHYVAQGLCVRMVASGQGALQQLAFDDGGDLLATTAEGAVKRYRDLDGDGVYSGGAEIELVSRAVRAASAAIPAGVPEAAEPRSAVVLAAPVKALPERWAGGTFVALHGSDDLDPPTGCKVVWAPPGAAPASSVEVVFGGGTRDAPRDGYWSWGVGGLGESLVRPVGVAISPIDGALYVSSDNASVAFGPDFEPSGAIYRIAMMRRPE